MTAIIYSHLMLLKNSIEIQLKSYDFPLDILVDIKIIRPVKPNWIGSDSD